MEQAGPKLLYQQWVLVSTQYHQKTATKTLFIPLKSQNRLLNILNVLILQKMQILFKYKYVFVHIPQNMCSKFSKNT